MKYLKTALTGAILFLVVMFLILLSAALHPANAHPPFTMGAEEESDKAKADDPVFAFTDADKMGNQVYLTDTVQEEGPCAGHLVALSAKNNDTKHAVWGCWYVSDDQHIHVIYILKGDVLFPVDYARSDFHLSDYGIWLEGHYRKDI